MKDQISEELLSAYFDGELSAKERIQIEHWLNSSPEARQQVADYRRISRMFEGLSRVEVPQEFPTEVLQLAERRMLLPDASTPVRRRPIRLWWVAVPTAAAAALLMVFNLSNQAHGPDRDAIAKLDGPSIRDNDLPGPDASGGNPRRGAEHDDESAQDESAQSVARLGTDAAIGESVLPVATPESGDVAQDKAALEKSAEKSSDGAALVALDSETDPQVAAVVDDAILAAIKTESGDQALSAVTIYVDGFDGLALIQRFLEENQIVASGESEREQVGTDPENKASKGVAPLSPGKQALCVVVTEPEPLVRAFTKMIRDRHPAMRIAAEDPIVIATLDDDSRARFAKAEREVSQSLERFAGQVAKDSGAVGRSGAIAPSAPANADGQKAPAARKAGAKGSPGAGIAKRGSSSSSPRGKAELMDRNGAEKIMSAAVKPPTGEVDRPEVIADADEDKTREVVSRQLVVPVPSEVQNRSRSRAANKLRAPSTENASRTQAQPANDDQAIPAKADADEKIAKPAPTLVRMMILVERESPPDEK